MTKRSRSAAARASEPLIIEVEGYDADDGDIRVINFRAETESLGVPDKIYCIGRLEADGVIRFADWGYATADETRRALGRRLRDAAERSDS